MLNKKILFFAILVGVVFVFSAVQAATTAVNGWAWSDNIGWIELAPAFGGVFIDDASGIFSGYAWSDNIGWVNFAPTSGFPEAPNEGAKLNLSTGQITGWIKAIAADNNGWDGWISMRGTNPNYGVSIDKTTGNFSGYAWGADVVGWVDFSKVTTSATTTPPLGPPVVSITADPNPIDYNASSTLTWSAVNADTCAASGDWTGSKNPVNGSESTGNLTSNKTYILTCTGPGGTVSKSVTVQVNPSPTPICALSAEPSSGQSPLDVVLTASGSGGSGTGYQYKFDYESDGTYDTLYSASNTSTHTYTEDSVAKAEVKDSYGTTATCGTASVTILGELSVSLTPKPSSNPSPLTTDLTAAVSGSAVGTINYTLWWNCDNPGTDVDEVTLACGKPYNPVTGTGNSDIGMKYDNILDTSITERHTYSSQGDYTAKVIVERGDAPAAQNRTPINVGPPVPWFSLNNSNALYATIIENQPVTTNKAITTISAYNYFDENVVLSSDISSVIPLATDNFSKKTLTSSDYSTGSEFSVNLPGAAVPGTYTITIKGDGGTFVSTEEVILNIESISTSEIWEF